MFTSFSASVAGVIAAAVAAAVPLQVAYDPEPGCPERSELLRQIAGRASAVPIHASLRVGQHGAGWRGELSIGPPTEGLRSIEGPTCEAVVAAAAVTLSLLTDDTRTTTIQETPRPIQPASPKQAASLLLGAGLRADVGLLPHSSLAATASVGAARGSWLVRGSGLVTAEELQDGEGRTAFRAAGAGVSGCHEMWEGQRLGVWLCGDAQAVWIRGKTPETAAASELVPRLGGSAAATAKVGDSLRLIAAVGVLWNVSQPSYVVDDVLLVHRVSGASLAATLTAEFGSRFGKTTSIRQP